MKSGQEDSHEVRGDGGGGRVAQRMGQCRLGLCMLGYAGVQISYSAQINLGTSQLFLLGMSERTVALTWLAGPLSGLIMQPLVGHLSDTCTSRLGRRRPFVIAGTLLTALSLLLFANSVEIVRMFAPDASARGGAVLWLAVIAFFALDFSVNAVQAPLRMLAIEIVPPSQRATANSYLAAFTGIGNLIGGILAALNLSKLFPFFKDDTHAVFSISAALLIATATATVLASPDPPLHRVNRTGYSPIPSVPRERTLINAMRFVPRPFWQAFAVQLCTWSGFFTLFVYVNAWVGRNVYLGDGTAIRGTPTRERFERGVRLGGLGNALTACVTLLYACAIPKLWDTLGIRAIYIFSQLTEAFCLMITPLLRGRSLTGVAPSFLLRLATVVDIAAFGIVWATTMALPWTLVGHALDSPSASDDYYARRKGFYVTIFNSSQAFPQLFIALSTPYILKLANDDPAWVMFTGGVFALLGALLVVTLKID